jgi:type IV secretion system protein VirB4
MWNLSEYRRRPQRLSDHLPWAALVGPGVVLNKDGSFQRTVRFRGPDLDSSTPHELMSVRARMNHVLRRFGSGWCLHIEAARRRAAGPPADTFPHSVAQLIDDERRAAASAGAGRGFESAYFLTFTWLPPEEQTRRAASLLFESPDTGAKRGEAVSYREFLNFFTGLIDQTVALMQGFMPEARPLDDAQTLTYLHACVSDRHFKLAVPGSAPFYLDALLTDRPFTGGLSPKLGTEHLKIVSIRAFANQTVPCLLDGLNELPIGYRWVVRWLPMDKPQAVAQLNKLRRQWFAKRKGVWSLLKEAVTKTESALEDTDALNKSRDVDAALQEVGGDFCGFGDLTLTIIVGDQQDKLATEKARAVQQVIDSVGFVSEIEDFNAVQAWLCSLPGHAYANVRRPMVSTLNLCDLAPLSTTWSGPPKVPSESHLIGGLSASRPGPFVFTQTAGSTPFRLSLHQGDVGHTLIVGPTGAGKSTLLNLLAAQWLRYPDARVYIFDKGASCRALTLACGGHYFIPGSTPGTPAPGSSPATTNATPSEGISGDSGGGVCFQPLAAVDREDELNWTQGWVADILQREGVAVTPVLKQEVWSALSNLGSMPVRQRTMSTLYNLVQDPDARHALKHYTLDGPYGQILDADWDALDDTDGHPDSPPSPEVCPAELPGIIPGAGAGDFRGVDWLAFEMEHLMHNRAALVPVLTYLFHRLEKRFGGFEHQLPGKLPGEPERSAGPTLLVLDEAWLYLTDSTFAARIREWLKVLRKKNVAVVFATQSLSDIANSELAPAIIESCLTRIFLPNPTAREEQTRKVYQAFGLNDRQLSILQQAVPKRDYYYASREGNRLFELNLGETALAFCAAGSPEDQRRIDRVRGEYDPADFAWGYLTDLGLRDAAELLNPHHEPQGDDHENESRDPTPYPLHDQQHVTTPVA